MTKYIVLDENGKPENAFKRFKRGAKNALDNTTQWMRENKELVEFAAPVAVYAIGSGARLLASTNRRAAVREEKRLKELYVYDNHTRRYYKLRRPLTNRERLEIDSREARGERLGSILSSMRVLK